MWWIYYILHHNHGFTFENSFSFLYSLYNLCNNLKRTAEIKFVWFPNRTSIWTHPWHQNDHIVSTVLLNLTKLKKKNRWVFCLNDWVIFFLQSILNMTREKGLRATSPIHVHVDDTPVHVHVKRGKKKVTSFTHCEVLDFILIPDD